FVAPTGSPAYDELNFAPSGEWAAYAFHQYREVAPLAEQELAPKIRVRSEGNRLELEALVRLDRLSAPDRRAPLRLALSAVVEEESGALSYWALRHPPGQPDFHHPDAFVLELDPPDLDDLWCRRPACTGEVPKP